MTDLILILSRCLNETKKVRENHLYYRFHFKGYYQGEKVNEILLKPQGNITFTKDEDYFLWVKKISFYSGILKVQLIKSKKIL